MVDQGQYIVIHLLTEMMPSIPNAFAMNLVNDDSSCSSVDVVHPTSAWNGHWFDLDTVYLMLLLLLLFFGMQTFLKVFKKHQKENEALLKRYTKVKKHNNVKSFPLLWKRCCDSGSGGTVSSLRRQ